MKRTASISTVLVAAVLIGGTGYSALATADTDRHGSGPEDRPSATASAAPTASPSSPSPSSSSSSASLTAAQAAAAARKPYPGTVTEVERGGDHPGYWEVHITGADHVRREVLVDIRTGAVHLDRHGDDDRLEAGDDRGGSTDAVDDRTSDDHGVHAGDDHPKATDDHPGDDGGHDRGQDRTQDRDRNRGGHADDDH
ncbi:PepSY domain-containing protein [Streptomyces mangrovisoli]|uniref:PepSY domain-containing protein n=1 Tax=Streptomyces mangrovisoli TaxID=1428628 RepID=A0A1J4NR01_9ACTN|nr:PepSY domain-containing protein [Streptomyces mangrovisoli]OIJ63677.1 hypothetical protein WN71_033225 [Streptomyces mangrovisoli]